MKKGQTSVRNGIEDFLCPFTIMNITQGANGALSHRGTMANDVAGSGGRDPYYAPCTSRCLALYPDSGQSMWQSLYPVRFANGNINTATYMIAHDNTQNCYVGQVINQGDQLGNMGDKGYATGIHCHIEIEQGSDTTWRKNEYGIWCFNNEVDTDDCYFVDNTQIVNGMGGNWKYLKDVPVEEPKTEAPTETPKKDDTDVKIAELNKTITQLQNEVESLKNELNKANDELSEYKNKLSDIPSVELIFESPKLDFYAIKLEEKQRLYIGK